VTSFSDDFNRANGAPGANWVDGTGLWTIVSNQLSSGSAGGTIVIRAATAMATNDNSAQITIPATAALSHGVWCRGNTGFTQGYLWRNDGTSWNLFSNVGGSFTSIGSFAGAAVAGDIAKVQAVGSTIKGFVNGVERVSVTNTAVTTGTSVGLRAESSNSLRFDDFSAADVSSGTTANADVAAATVTGYDATGAVSGLPGQAATAADAGAAPASIGALAGQAAGAADASVSGASSGAQAGISGAAADALAPSAALTVLPPETAAQAVSPGIGNTDATVQGTEVAVVGSSALDSSVALGVSAGAVTVSADAYDATTTSAPIVNASAEAATAGAAALDASAAVSASAGTAAGTADGQDAGTSVTVQVTGTTAGTADAGQGTPLVGAVPPAGSATAAVDNALAAVTVLAEAAQVVASAWDVSFSTHLDVSAGVSLVSASASPALSAHGAVPGTAGAVVSAGDISLLEHGTDSRERVSGTEPGPARGREPAASAAGTEPGGSRGRAPVSSVQGVRPVGRVSGREPGSGQ
jgi:hypothetical protein